MSVRPAFMFYPADWRNNANLSRCSPAARGVWMDLLCLLHDSEEYGVLRWPLKDLAQAAGASMTHLRELVAKGVLKGADRGAEPYVYRPRHAGQEGEPVILVEPGDGPCWYSSRLVRDEWVRKRRGIGTRFDDSHQPVKNASPKATPKPAPKPAPKPPLGATFGERQGDGLSFASSFAASLSSAPIGAVGPADVIALAAGIQPGTQDLTDSEEKVLWNAALALLIPSYSTGTDKAKDAKARSFVGGLGKKLKDAGVERRALFDVIQAACVERPVNPESWLAAAVATRVGNRKVPNKQEALEQRNRAVADEWMRKQGIDPVTGNALVVDAEIVEEE